ncbi:CDP-alcohol phosphatidyltransferase family protein [Geodermatophilus sp. TF02-6]|uniref:phosphatidylinositol phosphate synthase n=1 Tax=Geodermatophilus sp. TF02-6 TaxID=2250575 RepID=UPI000DEB2569|nr:CDP-alcohol phosphatidyltransferase family protein [Geodermatophilus sp. TF02-6]RBY76711.1 CDP-alcohol phosphatidyltransferase family protein [Geodermatophilus sp. TF02-6]
MLGVNARAAVARFWAPVVTQLVRAGVTADVVTVTGTLGAIAGSVGLIATGHLFWGAFTVTLCVLLDMLDGALARARGGGSVFGAVLDSTGDRAADAAIFGALVWWFGGAGDNRLLVLLALLCLVLGVLTSYVKARAEGLGLSCDVGIVERTERLILVLTGTGFTGLGIPYALHVALWVLLVGSAVTVWQRFAAVHRQSRGRPLATTSPPTPPTTSPPARPTTPPPTRPTTSRPTPPSEGAVP